MTKNLIAGLIMGAMMIFPVMASAHGPSGGPGYRGGGWHETHHRGDWHGRRWFHVRAY
jgi:hypothetical protein